MTVAPSNPLQRLMAVVALLLVAFGLRVALIDQVPPGLTHDEISQLDTAAQVRAGDWRLLYPGGFAADGAEPNFWAPPRRSSSCPATAWPWRRHSTRCATSSTR